MELNSRAKALAEIDEICDQYEQAYRRGELGEPDDEFHGGLNIWLEKVPASSRHVLYEELCSLWIELETEQANPQSTRRTALVAIIECPTFDALSSAAKLTLAARLTLSTAAAGSVIIRGGEPSTGLFLMTSGKANVMSVDVDGGPHIDHSEAGSVFGEISMIMGRAASTDVIAETDVELLHLSPPDFEEVRRHHPEVEVCLSQLTSDRLGSRSIDALCGKTLRGYRFLRCLGRGAMGVVYEAQSEADDAKCAVKMLRYRFIYDPETVTRFDREAELMRRLDHPNIISIRDHFVEYRTRFIVMDLCDRSDLRQWMQHHSPLDEATTRAIVGQVAVGLSHAHQHGVLHMDLKPANLLIDSAGVVRITDFGLSRLLGLEDAEKIFAGTPPYMSPEQLTMSKVGPSSDWYALACIAYELLVGRRLFSGDDRSVLQEEKLRAAAANWPNVPASDEFQRLVQNLLHPDPDRRVFNSHEVVSWARPVPELNSTCN